jgi:post-segregation antitoxin (ccd killing protein)
VKHKPCEICNIRVKETSIIHINRPDWLPEMAKAAGMNMSQFVRHAIHEQIERSEAYNPS